MFTGIVEELGTVVALERGEESARLTVSGPLVVDGAGRGSSIAVDGCCLTVVDSVGGSFTADVMGETLSRTTIGALAPGDRVNLERPVAVDGRLGGHVVQGHVDATGAIVSRTPGDRWDVVRIQVAGPDLGYLVEKGSIAVDGVSLTVVEPGTADSPVFSVALIPETLARTTLGHKGIGDPVNLEFDVLGKYVRRLVDLRAEGVVG